MRTFRDSAGVDWTVFEVRRNSGVKGDLSYLPSGFNDGWLCFESELEKKRLVKYPGRWRDFGDAELESLLADAQPAPRPSLRLRDDFTTDTPPIPDSRPE